MADAEEIAGFCNELGLTHIALTPDRRGIERAIAGKFVRAYVSMSFFCPDQGKVSFEEVNHVCERFVKLGADEMDIGDTNGRANPKMVHERFSRLRELYPDPGFVAHFHDTGKMALANALAAMQAGVRKCDSSAGGLGGSRFSPGATGNAAAEDLLHMLSQMDISKGWTKRL